MCLLTSRIEFLPLINSNEAVKLLKKQQNTTEAKGLISVKGYLAGLSLSALRNPFRWEPVNRTIQPQLDQHTQKCQTSSLNVGTAGEGTIQTRYFLLTFLPAG